MTTPTVNESRTPPAIPSSRTCFKCRKSKDLKEYHNRTGYPNNKNTVCKECLNKYNRSRYKERHIMIKKQQITRANKIIATNDADNSLCLYYGIASFV